MNSRLKRRLDRSERDKARLRERVRSLTKQMLAAGVMHAGMPPGINGAQLGNSRGDKLRRRTMLPGSSPRRQNRSFLAPSRDASTDYDKGLRKSASRASPSRSMVPAPPSTATVAAMARAVAERKLEERTLSSEEGSHDSARGTRHSFSSTGSGAARGQAIRGRLVPHAAASPHSRVPTRPWKSPVGHVGGTSSIDASALGPRSRTPPRWEFSLRRERGGASDRSLDSPAGGHLPVAAARLPHAGPPGL